MRDMGALQGSGTSVGQAMSKVGAGMLGVGLAIGTGMGAAVKGAADFEHQMDAVNASLGGVNTTVMADLEQQALDLGAATKFSAGEVAGVQEVFGKMGVTSEELLGGATQAALDLSAATGEQLVPSAEAAASVMNLFGLEGEQVTGVADTLTASLNNSAASLPDLQRGIVTLGSEMVNMNRYAGDSEQAFQDTAAAVAYFNANGLKAADAGISLARGMQNLSTAGSDAQMWMNELGIEFKDVNGNLLPLPDLFDSLQKGLAGASDETRNQALSAIFGAEAIDVMSAAVRKGGDPLREYEKLMESNGQAAAQAAIRMDNLKGAWETMMGSLSTAAIALGTPLIGPIRAITEGITGLLNAFLAVPSPVQAAVAVVAALGSGLLVAAGAALFFAGPIAQSVVALRTLAGAVQAAGGISAIAKSAVGAGGAFSKLGAAARGVVPALLGMGPLGIGIAAGLAVATVAVVAYQKNWLGFGDAVRWVGNEVKVSAAHMIDSLRPLGSAIKNEVLASFDHLKAVTFDAAVAGIKAFGQEFAQTFDQKKIWAAAEGFSGIAANVVAFGRTVEDVTGLPVAGFFDGMGRGLQATQDAFNQARDNGLTPFRSAMYALGAGIDEVFGTNIASKLNGFAADVENTFNAARDTVTGFGTDFQGAFTQARDNGLSPFRSALYAFGTAFDNVFGTNTAAMLNGFAASVENAWGAVQSSGQAAWDMLQRGSDAISEFASNLAAGDFAAAGQQLRDLGSAIKDGIGAIDWSGLASGIGDAASGLGSALSGAGSALVDGLQSGWDAAIGAFKSVMSALGPDLAALVSGTGTALSAAGAALVAGLRAGWDGAIEGFKAVMSALGPALGALVSGAGSALSAAGTALVTGLRAGWDAAIGAFKAVMSALGPELAALVSGVGTALSAAGSALVAGLRAGWDAAIEGFKAVMSALGPALGALVSGAGSALSAAGGQLVAGLRAGWDAAIGAFKSVMSSLGPELAALVSGAGSALSSAGSALVAGLRSGWDAAIGAFKSVMSSLGPELAALVSGAGTALSSAGTALVAGLRAGWDAAIGAFKAVMSSLGPELAALVSGAGSALSAAGGELVAGLSAGWDAAIGGFKSVMSALPADLAGLISGAGSALTSAGSALVEGLRSGWDSAIEGFKSIISSLGSDLAGLMDFSSITTALDGISTAIDTAASAVSGALTAFLAVVQPALDLIKEAFGEVSSTLGDAINPFDSMVPLDAGDSGKNAVKDAETAAAETGTTVGQAYADLFASSVTEADWTVVQTAIGAALDTAMTAAMGGPDGGQGPAQPGTGFGATMAKSLADGLASSIDSVPPGTFQPIATSFLNKIQEGVTLAMQTGTGDNPASEFHKPGGNMGESIISGFATSLGASASTIDPTVFQPFATALLGGMQTGISAALAAGGEQTGPGGAGMGAAEGIGPSIITGLVTSLGASVATVDPAVFQPFGTALLSAIQTGMTAALAAGGEQTGPGGAGLGAAGDIGTAFVSGLAAQIAVTDPTPIATSLQTLVSAAMAAGMGGGPAQGVGGGGRAGGDAAGGIGTSFVASLAAQIGGTDPAPIATALQTLISQALATGMSGSMATGPGTGGGGRNVDAGGIGASIVQAITSAVTSADFTTIGTALQTQMTTVIETAFTQMQTVISTAMNTIQTTIQTAFAVVGTTITTAMTTITTSVTTGFTAMQTAVSTAMNTIQTTFQTGFSVVASTVTTAMSQITTSISSGAAQWTAAIQASGSAMSAAISSAMAAVTAAVQSGMAAATAAVTSGVAAMIAAMQAAAAQAEAAGAAIGAGLASGMMSQVGAVQAAGAALADAASAAIAAAAQVASPSKVTTELGVEMGAGLAAGMDQVQPEVAAAARDLALTSLTELGSTIESAFDAGKRQGEAAAAGIASAESLIGQTWDQVLGQIDSGPAADYLNQMRADMQSGRGGGSRGSTNPADRIAEAIAEMQSRLSEGLDRLAERPIAGEVTMDGAATSRVVVGHIAKQGRRAHEVGGGRRRP